jgi:hypothetical protein
MLRKLTLAITLLIVFWKCPVRISAVETPTIHTEVLHDFS